MRNGSKNRPRPNWRKIRKRLDPLIRVLLASYTLTFVKGGRGANISELSFVAGLKYSSVSVLLKAMKSNQLASVFEVKMDKTKGLVKNCQCHRVPRVLPKNQLNRSYLRNMSRSKGPLGKLYLISLCIHEKQELVLKKLKTENLKDLLMSAIPSVVEYLKNCETSKYKFIKLISQIAIRDAHTVVERTVNLYEDLKFMDNRVLVLRQMEKALDSVETGIEKIRRRRELINELECCQKRLQTMVIPA